MACSVLVAISVPGPASSAALSLVEAERLAVARDAEIERLEAERESLAELSIAAGQLPDPRMRVGAVNVPTDSFSLDAEDMTMLELGVSQMFPAGDSRRLSATRYERQADALEARIADRRRVVVRELRKAWIEDAYLREAQALVQGQMAWFDPLVANAVARYGNGQLRQLDVVKATLEQATLRERLLDLRKERARAEAMLSRWLDVPTAQLATALPAPREWPALAVLESQLAAHPTQTEFDRRIEAAATGEALERQRYRPEWELDLAYGFRDGPGMDGGSRSDMVSAMVSFTLPLFAADRQDRAVAAARAETRSLQAMHEDHRRELGADLLTALDVARTAREIETLYDVRLVTLAERASDAATAAYANDTAQFDELIESATALLELKLGRLKAAAQRASADADLAYLAGETP